MKEVWLIFLSNTQRVQSRIKDIKYCKSTGREEVFTKYLALISSVLVSSNSKVARIDSKYINRKIKILIVKNSYLDYISIEYSGFNQPFIY